MNDWEIIRSVVASHEATTHAGTRCTCPAMIRAIKAAKAFEKQFGPSTPPGILPDTFDDRTGRWRTKTWMDADSTMLNGDDFRRLPKHVQQRKLRWLGQELEYGQAVLEETMPGAPKRRSPRQRRDEIVQTILAGARRTGLGTFTFSKSLNAEIGKDEATTEDVEALAVKKLEEDRRKQKRVEMGM